jgi:hypothetical protein
MTSAFASQHRWQGILPGKRPPTRRHLAGGKPNGDSRKGIESVLSRSIALPTDNRRSRDHPQRESEGLSFVGQRS